MGCIIEECSLHFAGIGWGMYLIEYLIGISAAGSLSCVSSRYKLVEV